MSQTIIPSTAVWNWDLWTEGSHILLESGPGGPRIMSFTANVAITAGDGLELGVGSIVNRITTTSLLGLGVATETAASGTHVPVCINGIVRGVTASGTIAAGGRVEGATPGQFRALAAQNTSNAQMGVAITNATNGTTFVLYVDPT